MNIKTLILLSISTIALCSCATAKKPVNDCSTIFEDNVNQTSSNQAGQSLDENGENEEPQECQVLKIKVNKDTNCEISGSDSADKVLELYQNDNNQERIVLISPIKSLDASDIIENYDTILTYYKFLNNIKDHVSSDVFNGLKKYDYKGIKCESKGNKFIGWIGEGQLIASYTGKVNSTKADASKSSTTKPVATKKAKGEVKVKTKQKSNQ